MLTLPLDDNRRSGFELELMAPVGKSRFDLARALARRIGGTVLCGNKFYSEQKTEEGKLINQLTPAFRVYSNDGRLWATLVDDNTLRSDVDGTAAAKPKWQRALLDDVRLALLAEEKCWTEEISMLQQMEMFAEIFSGSVEEVEATVDGKPHRRTLAFDKYGHSLAVILPYSGEKERACEVVTAPVLPEERAFLLDTIHDEAQKQGFFIPKEAALHVHLDHAPWRSVGRLAQLIVDFTAGRDLLREVLQPNPNCRRLGPFADELIKVAEHALVYKPAFIPFAEACLRAGATKYVDLNILGALKRRPRHPTIEVRCLPMSFDTDATLEKIDAVEQFLQEVAVTADEKSGGHDEIPEF